MNQTPPTKEPVYKGRLTGVYRPGRRKPIGNYIMSEIDWQYFRIDGCSLAGEIDTAELRTGDFWYAKVLRNRRKWRLHWPWQRKADIFIPYGENRFYQGDLYKVLVRNLAISREKTSFLPKDWDEATGDVYFQLKPKPKPKPPNKEEPSKPTSPTVAKGTNVIADPIVRPSGVQVESGTGTMNGGVDDMGPAPGTRPAQRLDAGTGSWAQMLGGLLALLVMAAIAYYLWKSFPVLASIFIALVVFRAVAGILKKYPAAKRLATLAILGFVGYYLYRTIGTASKSEQLQTKDGSIRVEPPKRSEDDGADGTADYTTEKNVKWFDFSERAYQARYSTSQKSFEQSVERHREMGQQIQARSNDPVQFASEFYLDLFRMDQDKIKKVSKIFSDSSRKMRLTPLQTAEMVVTFIQEIPYTLVHEGTCSKAVSMGNPFVVEYHAQKKPCLPNVSEGVQSPYEFLHNLKGDCDTRALLAYAILSQLNIGSSVWISEAYAHSIVGVAVPAGNGIFKEVRGVRHYGVELTAKGYRIGMVDPEQARPGNWAVTAFNNPN